MLPQDGAQLPQDVTLLPQDVTQLPQDGASCQRTAASWDSRNRIWCSPAPNSISDCFGVPVAKGQRRRGIREIKFGALQHQLLFQIVLACQLPKDSGVVGFKKSNLVLSSCHRTLPSHHGTMMPWYHGPHGPGPGPSWGGFAPPNPPEVLEGSAPQTPQWRLRVGGGFAPPKPPLKFMRGLRPLKLPLAFIRVPWYLARYQASPFRHYQVLRRATKSSLPEFSPGFAGNGVRDRCSDPMSTRAGG